MRYLILFSFLSLLTIFSSNAQELNITLTFPNSGNDRLSVCGGERLVNLDIENISGGSLSAVSAEFDISSIQGIAATSTLSGAAGATISASSPNLIVDLPDMTDGEIISFEVGLEALCDAIPAVLAGAATNFDITFSFAEGDGTETINTNNFEIVKPALSIIGVLGNSGEANIYDAAFGEQATIVASVANAGDGPLSEFVYYVIDHPSLALVDVAVAGTSLTVLGTSGDTTFVLVDAVAIANAAPGPQTNDTGLFQFNEILDIEVTWLADGCFDGDGPDAVHGAQYGCTADPTLSCPDEEDERTYGVRYGFFRPEVTAARVSTFLEEHPTCYATDEQTIIYEITNSGTGLLTDLVVDFDQQSTPNAAYDFEYASSLAGPYSAVTNFSQQNADWNDGEETGCLSPLGYEDIVFTITVNLDPGESIFIRHNAIGTCNCESGCAVDTQYGGMLDDLTYYDGCAKEYFEDINLYRDSQYASWNVLPESPIELQFGEQYTATYSTESFRVDWWYDGNDFNDYPSGANYLFDDYPNSYVEVVFTLSNGLDFLNGAGDVIWQDTEGDIVTPYYIDYTDNQGGDDILTIRFDGSFDGNIFNPSKSQILMNFETDCAEFGAGCVHNATISQQTFFTTDPACNCLETMSCAETMNYIAFCPDVCDCVGLNFEQLDSERLTLGESDSDDNGQPDNGPYNTPFLETDRFIKGDTLQSTLYGKITTDATYPSWEYAFASIDFGHSDILPLGGELTIYENGGATYTCSLLQQFFDGTSIVTNISPQNLIDLGCGLPPGFLYEDGDSLVLTYQYQNTEYQGSDVVFVNYNADFWVSDEDYGVSRFSCVPRIGRYTQVGTPVNYAQVEDQDFSGCDSPRADFYFWRRIGGEDIDYFPYEYRGDLQFLTQAVFTISDPAILLKEFQVRIRNKNLNGDNLGEVIGSFPDDPFYISPDDPFVVQSGTTYTVNLLDYMNANYGGYPDVDEGFSVNIEPQYGASCSTPPGTDFTVDYDYHFTLDPTVLGSVSHTQSYTDQRYNFVGGATLDIQTAVSTQTLLHDNACFIFDVVNTGNSDANNVYVAFDSPTGGVTVNELVESGTPVSDNLGIYVVGDLPEGDTKTFELCVGANNCNTDSIFIYVGYDCLTYPSSLTEALSSGCAEPKPLYVEPTEAELGMVIMSPTAVTTTDLCTETEYIVQLSSTLAGALNTINFLFDMPSGQNYVPNSFEIAYPPPSSGNPADATWQASANPTIWSGNAYQIIVDDQVAALDENGLLGTTNIGQNYMFVRFRTDTDCSYISGGAVNFYSWAYNSCGGFANNRFSPANAIEINGATEPFSSNISLNTNLLNPCLNETTAIDVSIDLLGGSRNTAAGDSISLVLPAGITYNANSIQNIGNAIATEPIIENINGEQSLYFPILEDLGSGDNISFTIDVTANDAAQRCADYNVIGRTFSTDQALCVGQNCSFRVLSDEDQAIIGFVKPDLSVSNFSATAVANPPSNVTVDYTFDVTNAGEPIPVGYDTNVEIYADLDEDGNFSAADLLLFTATTTDAIPTSGTITVSGTADSPSGYGCRVFAVINPTATCACDEDQSFFTSIPLDIPIQNDVFTTCSDALLTGVGPEALDNVTYEWLSVNGSDVGAFIDPLITPTDFQFANGTGSNVTWQFALKSTQNNTCAIYDTVQITILPENIDSTEFLVCDGSPFTLAGPSNGTNFGWAPSGPLDDPTSAQPTVTGGISSDTRFVLTYIDEIGCNATYIANTIVTACAATGVGDTIWLDTNADGLQDPGEPGIAGVVVYLYNATNPNTPISSTVSNPDGSYLFDIIPAGNYIIGFDIPSAYEATLQNVGGDDGIDSDADPITGLTQAVYIPNGIYDLTLDLGLIPCDIPINDLTDELCSYEATNVDLTTYESGVTTEAGAFTWYYDALLINSVLTPDNISVSDGDIFYVEFDPDNSNCLYEANIQFTVNQPTPVATASNTICEGDVLMLSSDDGFTSYSWTGPNSFASNLQNPTIPNATAAVNGAYTLVVTDANACTSQSLLNVSLLAFPDLTATANATPTNIETCLATDIILNSDDGFASYSWAGPNGFTSNLQSPTLINVDPSQTGTYTVTATNIYNCTVQSEVFIKIIPIKCMRVNGNVIQN
ncbi:MAG: SdrD B-like domain-containing protein [Chitinophagales bacterium]